MRLYLSSHHGGWRNASAVAGAALVAAVVPVSAVLALALSSRAKHALAARFVRAAIAWHSPPGLMGSRSDASGLLRSPRWTPLWVQFPLIQLQVRSAS